MRVLGKTFQEISGIMRRDRRSVERAYNRYPVPWHMKGASIWDRAKYAYEESKKRRGAPRRRERLKSRLIREYVELKLTEGLSPELIAGRLSIDHPGSSISHEAIYEWVFKVRKDLKKYLLRAGKTRRGKPGGRACPRRQPAAPKKSIEQRPAIVEKRERIGDYESDLIVSGKSDACLLVVVDRRFRKVHLCKLQNRQAETVKSGLAAFFFRIPSYLRYTLTQDNGPEHALHAELAQATGLEIFFCHPYSACERGTVENRNGIVRRYFPKGTDFSLVTDEEVARVERLINSRPMVILGFLTPDEAYQQEVERIQKLAA